MVAVLVPRRTVARGGERFCLSVSVCATSVFLFCIVKLEDG